MAEIQGPQIDRRTIVRTAAWGVPVATLVGASPAFADSTLPACPVIASGGGTLAATAAVTGGTGDLALAGGFTIDASQIPTGLFVDGFAFIVNSATVAMSNGQAYTSVISGGAGAATTSLLPVALPSGVVVRDIPYSGGTYGNLPGQNALRPVGVTANVTMTFVSLVGPSVQCTYDLTWTVSNAVGAGVVGFGAGTVSYVGTVAGSSASPVT